MGIVACVVGSIVWHLAGLTTAVRFPYRVSTVTGMARDPGSCRNAHTLDSQARDLVELPSRAAKPAVRRPRVRTERYPADVAAIPPPSARLHRKPTVAHDVEARLSTVVAPGVAARYLVDRVHRSSVTARRTPWFRPRPRSTANGTSTPQRATIDLMRTARFSDARTETPAVSTTARGRPAPQPRLPRNARSARFTSAGASCWIQWPLASMMVEPWKSVQLAPAAA